MSQSLTRRRNVPRIITIIIAMIVIVSIPLYLFSYYSVKEYSVTVTDKGIKNHDNDSDYLVYTKLENGETRVFTIKDDLFLGRFNSSDIYAEFEIGKTYTLRVVGWRIPFFSAYENIKDIN